MDGVNMQDPSMAGMQTNFGAGATGATDAGATTTTTGKKDTLGGNAQDTMVAADNNGASGTTTVTYGASAKSPTLLTPVVVDLRAKVKTGDTQGQTGQDEDAINANKTANATGGSDGTQGLQQQDQTVDGQPEQTGRQQNQDGQGGNGGSQGGGGGQGKNNSGDATATQQPLVVVIPNGTLTPEAATRVITPNATLAINADATTLNANLTAATVVNAQGANLSPVSGQASPPTNPLQFFQNANKSMGELNSIINKLVASMPDGPQKGKLLDFLKAIGDALVNYQQLLNTIASSDSKGARDRAQAQLEASKAKLDEYTKKTQDIRGKQNEADGKGGQKSVSDKILGWLGVVATIVAIALVTVAMCAASITGAGIAFGAIAIAFLVVALVDQIMKMAGDDKAVWGRAFEACDKAANAIMDDLEADGYGPFSEQDRAIAGMIMKTVLVVAIVVVAAVSMGPVFLMGGVGPVMDMVAKSNVIHDAVKMGALADGQSADKAEEIGMWTQFAIITAVTVVCMIAGGVSAFKGGGAAAEGAVKAGKAAQMGQKVMTAVDVGVALASFGAQTTSTVTGWQFHTLMADIVKEQAGLEADIEIKDSLISLLKQMMKKLLESMESAMKDAASTGEMVKKFYDGQSQALEGVTSSLSG